MAPIIPRWEWRTFGDDLGKAAAALARYRTGSDNESDEIYFLSPGGENVKVRDGLMDIKVLREVDPDGLEQWFPVMKAAFPLAAADVTKVYEGLHVEPPQAGAASRHARRAHHGPRRRAAPGPRREGAQAPAALRRSGSAWARSRTSWRTTAGRKPSRSRAKTRRRSSPPSGSRTRRLGEHELHEGLAALVDGKPARYATIDCGTNSIKFHVAERGAGGKWRTVVDRAEMTRLGEGLEASGRIGPEPLERTVTAIAGMVREASEQGALAIAAVGTAGLRIASNSREIARRDPGPAPASGSR